MFRPVKESTKGKSDVMNLQGHAASHCPMSRLGRSTDSDRQSPTEVLCGLPHVSSPQLSQLCPVLWTQIDLLTHCPNKILNTSREDKQNIPSIKNTGMMGPGMCSGNSVVCSLDQDVSSKRDK